MGKWGSEGGRREDRGMRTPPARVATGAARRRTRRRRQSPPRRRHAPRNSVRCRSARCRLAGAWPEFGCSTPQPRGRARQGPDRTPRRARVATAAAAGGAPRGPPSLGWHSALAAHRATLAAAPGGSMRVPRRIEMARLRTPRGTASAPRREAADARAVASGASAARRQAPGRAEARDSAARRIRIPATSADGKRRVGGAHRLRRGRRRGAHPREGRVTRVGEGEVARHAT